MEAEPDPDPAEPEPDRDLGEHEPAESALEEPQIEVLLYWSGGPPVLLSYPLDLARAYIDAACAVPGHGMPELGDLSDPDDVALGLGYAFNAVAIAGLPIYGFDESGMWAFQPDAYRGIRIVRGDRQPPSPESMRRAIGFRPPTALPPRPSPSSSSVPPTDQLPGSAASTT